jgi:transcriptional regulator with XRE-family HTH domain
MTDLRKRFGRLVAAHRRRMGLTQEALAEAADLSVDMISKIEVGLSGARFPVIERLATVLAVDPAEFFTTEIASGARDRKAFTELSLRLVKLSEPDLEWATRILDAVFQPRGSKSSATAAAPNAASAVKGPRREKRPRRAR